MREYKIKYWFEWGGTCLWSANDTARQPNFHKYTGRKLFRECFGYGVC